MLYISKSVTDNLPDDLTYRLIELSIERQTLFECFYHRFSEKSREDLILLYMIYEGVKATNMVK